MAKRIFVPASTPAEKRLFSVTQRTLQERVEEILSRPNAFRRNPITGVEDFNPFVMDAAEQGNQVLVDEVQSRVEQRQAGARGRVVSPGELAGRVIVRPLEAAFRPIQVAGAVTGAGVPPMVSTVSPQVGRLLGARQRGGEVAGLFGQAVTGKISPRELGGRLIEEQEKKPLLQQVVSELPASLIPPTGGAKTAVTGAKVVGKAATRATAKGLVRVPQRRVQEAGLRLAGAKGMAGGAIPKEPWEMTKLEYALRPRTTGGMDFGPTDPMARIKWQAKIDAEDAVFHREGVKEAIEKGKPVPSEVLADYPDLAAVAKGQQEMIPPTKPIAPKRQTFAQFKYERNLQGPLDQIGGALSQPGLSASESRYLMKRLQRDWERYQAGVREFQSKIDAGEIIDPTGEFRPKLPADPTIGEIARLEHQASELEGLASRGMRPKVHKAQAAKLRLQVEELKQATKPVAPASVAKPAAQVVEAQAWATGGERPFTFDPNSTANQGRFRLLPPKEGGKYITRQSGTPGISYIVDTEANAVQAVRFNKAQFPEAKAAEWWAANKGRFKFSNQAEVAGGVVRKEAVEDIATAPPPVRAPTIAQSPIEARTPASATLGGIPEKAVIPERTAAGVVPPSPAAKPPTRQAVLRLSIRDTKRQGGGFLVSGRDTKGRQVRVFAKTLLEAKQARENIRRGVEAFPGTEAEATQRALTRAERRYRATLKRGEAGAIGRAKTELEQLQSAGVTPPGAGKPPARPSLPPKIPPDGGAVPMPSWESARSKLISLIRNAARRGQKDIEALRATERSRRFAQSRRATEAALARGESPLPGIRTAQRGEMPIAELALPDRLTGDEVAVLRDSIYKTLGPELDWTSANIEEALTRLATEGKIPTDSELQWMEEIFGPELIEALRAQRTGAQKAMEMLLEAWNFPRALLASFDDSMVLRQGLHLLPEGVPAARAFKAHIRALTKAGSVGINEEIRASPWFNHARAHGLDMSLPSLTRGLAGREEVFMGARLAQRVPIVGKGVEVSERVATAYLNKLRMETYAAHASELKRIGAGFDAFKDLATNINILSGRASLGRAQSIGPFLNGMFFSARLNWAAAQRPFRILKYAPDLNTEEGRYLAKMLAKDVYGVWAGIAGMVGLAAAAGVAVVELDPRSSDFGKMQIGTVRVDPWAGQQQWATMMARIVSGSTKTTTSRQIVPADMVDVLGHFIESKVHPALGHLITIKEGKTYVGEDLTLKEFAKSWLPLFIQDISEVVAGTSPGVAGALGTAAFFGVSVYNIPGVPATVLAKFQAAVDAYNDIPTDALDRKPGELSRTQYRERNPVADAALFLAGQVANLESVAAVQEVVRLVQEHGLNPDHIRGIAERKEWLQKAAEAGRPLESNNVDALIAALENDVSVTGAPSPSTPSRYTPLKRPLRSSTMPKKPTTRRPARVPVGAR